jgi:hypothetical protein
MPRVAYTNAQKAEAVALARVAGAELAAQQLGIDPRTIHSWMDQAGDPPELEGSAEGWRQLLDLAQAKVAAYLTGGKVNPVTAATIAGISERNLAKLTAIRGEPVDPETSTWDAILDPITDEVMIAAIRHFDGSAMPFEVPPLPADDDGWADWFVAFGEAYEAADVLNGSSSSAGPTDEPTDA